MMKFEMLTICWFLFLKACAQVPFYLRHIYSYNLNCNLTYNYNYKFYFGWNFETCFLRFSLYPNDHVKRPQIIYIQGVFVILSIPIMNILLITFIWTVLWEVLFTKKQIYDYLKFTLFFIKQQVASYSFF